MLLLPQIAFESFQTLSEFLLSRPQKSTVSDFSNFEFLIFHNFSFSLTWDPIGAKTLQNATPPSNHFELFQSVSEFSSEWSSQK